MPTITFIVGDSYPNLFDTVEWPGAIPTDAVSGIMVSNGEESGQFTGALVKTSNVSNDPEKSTWSWSFDVTEADTEKEGSFKLYLRLTHENGDVETININTVAKVIE